MFDFGSILGSGTVYAQRHRPGNEYIFEQKPGWLTLATLGLYVRPWMTIDYPRRATLGRTARGRALRSTHVEAGISQPGLRQHAAGRCVLGRAHRVEVLATRRFVRSSRRPRYSDPAATDFMTKTIIARRDKVVAAWINQVCPVVDAGVVGRRHSDVHERSRRCESRHSTRAVRAQRGSGSITRPISEHPSASR